MPRPFASPFVLTAELRQQLQTLVRARSTPQALVFRCRLILRAAGDDNPPTSKLPRNWTATGTPSASGGNASCRRPRRPSRRPTLRTTPELFPRRTLAVVNLASSKTEDHDQPATRWSLDELAAAIVNEAHHRAMSRATIRRILDDADLKPHQSVYWLNSHDPDFDAKAQAICQLYVNAPRCYQQGRLVICCDEKTGMQILQRKYPTQPAAAGQARRNASSSTSAMARGR